MRENSEVYLLQRKHTFIHYILGGILSSSVLTFFLLLLILVAMQLSGTFYEIYEENFWQDMFKLLFPIYLLTFPYFFMIVIAALYYKCYDRVEFNSKSNTLIVNGTRYKIIKTIALKLILGWDNKNSGVMESITDNCFASGIIMFTLENNIRVNILSVFPKLKNYPIGFNYDASSAKQYYFLGNVLMYSSSIAGIILTVMYATSGYNFLH